MSLNIPLINNAKILEKQYKLADSGGLYLLVHPNGSKYWRLKYRFLGKEKTMAFGVYPAVSLKEARLKRDSAKKTLSDGDDPVQLKKSNRRAQKINAENSFNNIAFEWWNNEKDGWKEDHANNVWRTLEVDVLPYLGSRPITGITSGELLDVVRAVESRGALDVASRILQRCGAVFRFAIQTDRLAYNPARELQGALKSRKVKSRPSMSREELPHFLKSIDNYSGEMVTILALRLTVLTFVRPAEIRFARWEEFDLEDKLWRIPAVRMKMSSDHLVPLPKQTIDLLERLRPITGHYDLLFPGFRGKHRPISENTMNQALNRMGYKGEATPHGFRNTANSILIEKFNIEAVDKQLGHQQRNKVRAVYSRHAEYLEDRVKIMDWWGNYVEQQETSSNVIAANFGVISK
jgi:integrase